MLRILLAPDSFKECMTATEACAAMQRGILKALPQARCVQVPLADGGEGFLDVLVAATGGELCNTKVEDPLGHPVNARYGLIDNKQTAVIEMAEASGMHLLHSKQRNPMLTSTYGTGMLMAEALNRGVSKIILGLGGSATNDGGAGMLQALGARLLTDEGLPVPRGGGFLNQILHIEYTHLHPRFKAVDFILACDVDNPLTGPMGASAVFGPQKGATPEMVARLDANLEYFALKLQESGGKHVAEMPCTGAAGGLGVPLLALGRAHIARGIDLIMDACGLEQKIIDSDVVFTGEGSIDRQTASGKVPAGVAQLCVKHRKPLIALAGKVADLEVLKKIGFTAVFSINPPGHNPGEALKNGRANMEIKSEEVARMLVNGDFALQ